ncbi:hypothetical protein BDV96DRAFT_594617 [Lophiotrema nucula]|uniref:Uncharacterized protein n=1 Tax=Lophiotrema nucula TaxID=690887 RepID=A0A6A5ZQ93_9PLEO|nr:hypothetical protein BDV96DRAFT_594617 [Lophiotrema nucula]
MYKRRSSWLRRWRRVRDAIAACKMMFTLLFGETDQQPPEDGGDEPFAHLLQASQASPLAVRIKYSADIAPSTPSSRRRHCPYPWSIMVTTTDFILIKTGSRIMPSVSATARGRSLSKYGKRVPGLLSVLSQSRL